MKAEKMLPKIEILIEQLMDRKYQIINLSETEWKKIRSHYIEIKKTKKKIDTISEENIVGFDRDKYYNRTNQSKDVKRAINEFGEDLIEMKG
jgi:acyl-ACP thioesterase